MLTLNISKTRLRFIFPAIGVIKIMEPQNLWICWSASVTDVIVSLSLESQNKVLCYIESYYIHLDFFYLALSRLKALRSKPHSLFMLSIRILSDLRVLAAG